MKRANLSLPELLLGEQVPQALSIITGVSGSGKSLLHANADWNGVKVVALDPLGAKVEGKWLVDVAKIPPDTDIVVGWCDNLAEVAKTLRSFFGEGEPLSLYWLVPSPDIFRAANAAKAKDAPDRAGSGERIGPRRLRGVMVRLRST
jgi:hypothetical protein